jgi:hypothetical protein
VYAVSACDSLIQLAKIQLAGGYYKGHGQQIRSQSYRLIVIQYTAFSLQARPLHSVLAQLQIKEYCSMFYSTCIQRITNLIGTIRSVRWWEWPEKMIDAGDESPEKGHGIPQYDVQHPSLLYELLTSTSSHYHQR